MVSLGCAKNLVDAEIMVGSLLRDGMEVVNDPGEADALIVNTCSFIDAAQEESVDTILESAEFRAGHRPGQAVIVSGCLTQRFRDELPSLLPEVDAFMGIDQVEEVGRIVGEAVARRAGLEQAGAGVRKGKADGGVGRKGAVKARLAALEADPGKGGAAGGVGAGRGTEARPGAGAGEGLAVEANRRPKYLPRWDSPRFRLTPRHFAYVKIAEGCNHPCSFCIIPRMRGSHRSRAQADIVEEARRLVGEGVRELNLISQDSTYYGMDLRPGHRRTISSPDRFAEATRAMGGDATTLGSLLEALDGLSGDFWIRLLYTHPAHWTDGLIATMAGCRKVARYVDMPLQHIHDDMLARMRRETDGGYIRDLIGRLRAGIPGVALRTTFIVGFPGETAAHFEALLGFLREARFERMGVFAYSKEDGTVAGRMAGQVPIRTRQRRRERAMAEQHAVAREIAASFVGREMRVLVEGKATAEALAAARVQSWEHGLMREAGTEGLPGKRRSYWVGRGEADAPDIDGRVYLTRPAPVGEFVTVRVIGHTDYDLIAEPAAE
ncbi:MAG: 30S ribosomal protein S12 methylthiotransferase RimO [Verrucomicrobiae bacterium]|nr:30S ribosomal protein S12 methylthiotransferase RimO [Verrucomicrobiae bacterium]